MKKRLFLIAASALFAHGADYDCSAGCSLNAYLMGPQVCGSDGLTYANECFAYCQGIELDSVGPCESLMDESAFVVNSEVIDEPTITRFEEEDFRFVTKRTQYATKVENLENMPESDDFETDEIGLDLHFVRITSEGYEYATRYTILNETTGPTTPYKGLAEGYEFFVKNRHLIVVENDTRTAVPDTTIFPFRAIGAADFSWGNNSCTVTMISRKSALTAAHCVWNYAEGKPMPMIRVAPGRFFDLETNKQKDPFGTWEVDYTTAFGPYREMKSRTFDMAVVTYKPISRPDLGCSEVYPGDIVGYVSIDSVIGTETAVTDPRIANITITGYPYDFRSGEMTTSGPCSPPARSNGANYLRYFCDTAGGMSGSALLTRENIALGNHAGGSNGANVGPVMNKDMFDAVYAWAGLLNETQMNCRPPDTVSAPQSSCPCRSGGNPWNQILCWFLNIQGCLRIAKQSTASP